MSLLTKDKLQQVSKGRGRGTSAEVMGVHKMFSAQAAGLKEINDWEGQ